VFGQKEFSCFVVFKGVCVITHPSESEAAKMKYQESDDFLNRVEGDPAGRETYGVMLADAAFASGLEYTIAG
jgi:hypothetical protein